MKDQITETQAYNVRQTLSFVKYWARASAMNQVEFRVNGVTRDFKTADINAGTLNVEDEIDIGFEGEATKLYVGCTIDMDGHIVAVTGNDSARVNQFDAYCRPAYYAV